MQSDILKKTAVSGSEYILNGWLNGRNAACTFGAILGAIILFTNAETSAQSTVVIGGSGRSSVEVNLDVLEPGSSARAMGMISATGRILRMPNDHLGGTVKLRKPAGMKSASTRASKKSKSAAPKFVLKPPSMPVIKAKKPRSIARPKAPAMPKAKVPTVIAKPMPKPVTAAPKQITKAVPVVPKAPVVAAPPPPPPAAPVVKAAPVVVAQPVAKSEPAPVQKVPAPKAPTKVKTQVASVSSLASLGKGLVSRVNFAGSSTRLNEDAKNQLRDLATKIAASGERLQLKAFAGGTGGSSSSARRLSLSRALTVRSYLIESGVRSTRIGVRALGRAVDSGPPDRVDLILLAR